MPDGSKSCIGNHKKTTCKPKKKSFTIDTTKKNIQHQHGNYTAYKNLKVY